MSKSVEMFVESVWTCCLIRMHWDILDHGRYGIYTSKFTPCKIHSILQGDTGDFVVNHLFYGSNRSCDGCGTMMNFESPWVLLLKQHEPRKIGHGQQVCCSFFFCRGVVGELAMNARGSTVW